MIKNPNKSAISSAACAKTNGRHKGNWRKGGAANAPRIGHLKSDSRMGRNLLKGQYIRRPCRAFFWFPSDGASIQPASPSFPASAWPSAAVPERPQPIAPAFLPQLLHGFCEVAAAAPSPGLSLASENPKPSQSTPWEHDEV